MVERAGYSTHPDYLTETIHFQALASTIDPQEIAALYVKKRLTLSQVAERYGRSKSFILMILKRQGLLRHRGVAQTDPTNYRCPTPPFGYRVLDGRLVTYEAELKVCRMIVDLIDRQGFNFLKTAQHLSRKGIKNRRGTVYWHNHTVGRIYRRWKGKI